MKGSLVLDAGVLTLHFLDDARVRRYFDDVADQRKTGHMASVNLSEFYYKACEKLGKGVADIRYYQARRSGINVVETDEELDRTAGVEKCRHATVLSLADCYALAFL